MTLTSRIRDSLSIFPSPAPVSIKTSYSMQEHPSWMEIKEPTRLFNSLVYGNRTNIPSLSFKIGNFSLSDIDCIFVDPKGITLKIFYDPISKSFTKTPLENVFDTLLTSITSLHIKPYTNDLHTAFDFFGLKLSSIEERGPSLQIKFKCGHFNTSYLAVFDRKEASNDWGELKLYAFHVNDKLTVVTKSNLFTSLAPGPVELLQANENYFVFRHGITAQGFHGHDHQYLVYDIHTSHQIFCHHSFEKFGEDHKPQKAFLYQHYCLLYSTHEEKKRADLIDLQKKLSIPLTRRAQELFCSFDPITHLSIDHDRIVIEGIQKGEKIRIESSINPQQSYPLVDLDQYEEISISLRDPPRPQLY